LASVEEILRRDTFKDDFEGEDDGTARRVLETLTHAEVLAQVKIAMALGLLIGELEKKGMLTGEEIDVLLLKCVR